MNDMFLFFNSVEMVEEMGKVCVRSGGSSETNNAFPTLTLASHPFRPPPPPPLQRAKTFLRALSGQAAFFCLFLPDTGRIK